jgi:hypothetical protein
VKINWEFCREMHCKNYKESRNNLVEEKVYLCFSIPDNTMRAQAECNNVPGWCRYKLEMLMEQK